MNVPEDKQTVILLLQSLIDKKQVFSYRDYGSYAAISKDRKRMKNFKILSQRMLDKFKVTKYSPEHMADSLRSVDRIRVREEGGLWSISYTPGQYEPTEIHQAIYRLLVRYFDSLLGVPTAELTSLTYNCQCPYCSYPNKITIVKGEGLQRYGECESCYMMILLPEEK